MLEEIYTVSDDDGNVIKFAESEDGAIRPIHDKCGSLAAQLFVMPPREIKQRPGALYKRRLNNMKWMYETRPVPPQRVTAE